jgi:hypothetical protein
VSATARAAAGDRTDLWLPLLRRLTESTDTWLVWKNVESAFEGIGDVDAAATRSDWPVIETEFRRWAAERGVGPVVVCRHIPGGLNLIAVPEGWATFLEMGVKAQRVWRGATLFELEDLLPMAVFDERGFRRLRPGAEGLFKLLLNGTRRDGGANESGLRGKRVRELLAADPEGVREAAALLGAARRPALRGARRAAAGGWDRAAMLAVEGWAFLEAVRVPRVSLARVRFRLRGRATCLVVEAILGEGRRIPADRNAWLRSLARNHAVFVDQPSAEPAEPG